MVTQRQFYINPILMQCGTVDAHSDSGGRYSVEVFKDIVERDKCGRARYCLWKVISEKLRIAQNICAKIQIERD